MIIVVRKYEGNDHREEKREKERGNGRKRVDLLKSVPALATTMTSSTAAH